MLLSSLSLSWNSSRRTTLQLQSWAVVAESAAIFLGVVAGEEDNKDCESESVGVKHGLRHGAIEHLLLRQDVQPVGVQHSISRRQWLLHRRRRHRWPRGLPRRLGMGGQNVSPAAVDRRIRAVEDSASSQRVDRRRFAADVASTHSVCRGFRLHAPCAAGGGQASPRSRQLRHLGSGRGAAPPKVAVAAAAAAEASRRKRRRQSRHCPGHRTLLPASSRRPPAVAASSCSPRGRRCLLLDMLASVALRRA